MGVLKTWLHGLRVTRIRTRSSARLARQQVDCLFRLDHNSRVDQLEAAFHALGSEIAVEIKAAA